MVNSCWNTAFTLFLLFLSFISLIQCHSFMLLFPLRFLTSFSLIICICIHTDRDRYTNINLLSPFCLVHLYMFSGLTSWYWIINALIPGENSFSIFYQSWIDYSSLSRCGVLWDFTYLCWHANLGSLVKVLLGQP